MIANASSSKSHVALLLMVMPLLELFSDKAAVDASGNVRKSTRTELSADGCAAPFTVTLEMRKPGNVSPATQAGISYSFGR